MSKEPKKKDDKYISIPLNLMLLSEDCDISRLDEIFENYKKEKKRNLLASGNDYVLYMKCGEPDKPAWLNEFEKIWKDDISHRFKNTCSQGLTFLKEIKKAEKKYIFAINYGYGWLNIKKNKINGKFGIYVASKIISDKEAKIKNSQSRNLDGAATNKKRMFSNSLSDNELFALLDEAEVTRELGAIADKGSTDFSSLVGKYGPLNIRLKIKDTADKSEIFNDVIDKLKHLIDLYENTNDSDLSLLFKGVRPTTVKESEELFNKLPNLLKDDNYNFCLFEPECDFDVINVNGYQYKIGEKNSEVYEKLDLKDYLALRTDVSLDNLKEDSVSIINFDNKVEKSWSILSAIYGEYISGQDAIILSNKIWHKIIKSKYERINKKIEDIECVYNVPDTLKSSTFNKIKEYMKTEECKKTKKVLREDCFNKSLSEEKGYILLDKKCITIDNNSLEVCDVLKLNPLEFIHVKIGTDADKLSHLFAQGYASARAYTLNFDNYIEKVEEKIGNEEFLPKDIKNNNVTINYMILNQGHKNELTFLNKMTIIEKIENMEAFGFKVKLSWVNDIDLYPKKVTEVADAE